MKVSLAWFTLAVGAALSSCALEPTGPSPYGYWGAPYGAPYAPYAPYGYAGSTLGYGVGAERWHERDRDWRRDHDWHREGTGESHHHAERSLPGSVATAPPGHAAPSRPAPPSTSSEKPAPPFHGSAF